MNKTTRVLLLVTELALIAKLVINEDLLLAITITLSQLMILIAMLNFQDREEARDDLGLKRAALFGAALFISVLPMLLNHQNKFEPSSWSEASLLVQGPLSIVLIILGGITATFSALASLYLRGTK